MAGKGWARTHFDLAARRNPKKLKRVKYHNKIISVLVDLLVDSRQSRGEKADTAGRISGKKKHERKRRKTKDVYEKIKD